MLLDDTLVKIIEGLLFVSDTPLQAEEIAETLAIETSLAIEILEKLKANYKDDVRGFCLRQVAGGYQFYSSTIVAPYLEKLFTPRFSKLSNAAYETLAIIAYRQPVTRGEIEMLRGVKSEGPLQQLISRNLVEELGRKDAPGRPILFGTGKTFLQAFGLNDLEELPNYEEGRELASYRPELSEEDGSEDIENE